ncbi:MAG: ribosome biogenesis GTPase YlqF, partial [Planctomycetota bacterium]
MSIQWFPGHMHKARLEMEAVLPKVHVVVEILDARIPYSSENPLLAEIRGDKPCLKVLAKSDLADPKWTASWLEHFQSIDHIAARCVTSKEIPTIRRLKQAIGELARHREGKTATAMVVGIPNVGKSTIINVLAGRKVAKTGNTPAITKQQQTVRIGDGVTLLDTPGMLWPKVENPNSGLRLGVVGSVK